MAHAFQPMRLSEQTQQRDPTYTAVSLAGKGGMGGSGNGSSQELDTCGMLQSLLAGNWYSNFPSKDDAMNTWSNLALVCALGASIACAQLYAGFDLTEEDGWIFTVEHAYKMVSCFSMLGFLTATIACLCLIIGASDMESENEVALLVDMLGNGIKVPFWLACASGASMYGSIVLYFVLECGIDITIKCVAVCASVCFAPLIFLMTKVVWGVHSVQKRSRASGFKNDFSANDFISQLTSILDENGESFMDLSRSDFLKRFVSFGDGGAKLAAQIFDDWVAEQSKQLLSEDRKKWI